MCITCSPGFALGVLEDGTTETNLELVIGVFGGVVNFNLVEVTIFEPTTSWALASSGSFLLHR